MLEVPAIEGGELLDERPRNEGVVDYGLGIKFTR
jgi:hypothetical protein